MSAPQAPPFLPYGRQSVDEDDIAAVAEVLRGDWLTTGPAVTRFEAAVAAKVAAAYAVACTSGTAGLHLAAMALGLGPGDVALVPSVTFLATANAVRMVGAEVAFADVDPETGLLTAETLEAALARATGPVKAVFPVHLKGVVADPAAISAVAARHGLALVEDAAHALGTRYVADGAEVTVGACAHAAMTVFSTHPVKTATTGEGGIVTTNDPALDARLRRFRSHGMEHAPDAWLRPEMGFEDGVAAPWYYEMAEIGYNYRLPDFNCALGLAQLAKLDRFVARRAELVARYDRLLAPLAPHVLPPIAPPGVRPGWHLYAARIDFAGLGRTRTSVMRALREKGVGTQVHYIPVHQQPYYRARCGALELPGADAYYRRTLSLPLFPAMADTDVDRVVETLAGVLERG
jgi:UDP-4-amino-4,6-dideoxy-N-acetyl-beta-L-altrosamine transaminase